MDFYQMSDSIRSEIIGPHYPQITKTPNGYAVNDENSVYNISLENYNSIVPNINNLPLPKRSKLTDIISCSYLSRGFLISERVKSIFEKVSLPSHTFYSASVLDYQSNLHTYFYFFFFSDLSEIIDFENSSFYTGYVDDKTIHRFDSLRSFLEAKNRLLSNLEFLLPENITFKQEPIYDIFNILEYDTKVYISDKLYSLLNEFQVSGVDFH